MAVVIPTHCQPHVVKLTVRSLLRACPNIDLNIHLGVHSNYHHYTTDLSLFQDLKHLAHIHLVDEIDWMAHNSDVTRYSRMHAKNLENLLHQIKFYEFDYVLVLDNDVFVKDNFIDQLLHQFSGADLIGAYFDDKPEPSVFNHANDNETLFALPKISVWHVLLSRRLYERILDDTSILYPREERDLAAIQRYMDCYPLTRKETPLNYPVFIDTFSDVLHHAQHNWEMKVATVPTQDMAQYALHFYASSFNYGGWAVGHKETFDARLQMIKELCEREFPADCTRISDLYNAFGLVNSEYQRFASTGVLPGYLKQTDYPTDR